MTGLELEPVGREVVHPVTGEILDLSRESVGDLAERIVDLQEARESLAAFDQALGDAVLDHCDKSATWTLRVGDPAGDRQLEIKAASPSAGTETYPPDRLHDALALLIDTKVISKSAASSALQRRLVLELDVPWGEDPQALANKVRDASEIHVAGVKVGVARADPASRVSAAGVKALRKIPNTADPLDDALVTQDPPRRRVKVTVKEEGQRMSPDTLSHPAASACWTRGQRSLWQFSSPRGDHDC